ncbi:MAG: FecR family protein [Syntrophales bacterium]
MNCHKRIITLLVLVALLAWGGMGAVLAADNRGRSAPADALPKELKNVSVKDYFLPGKTKEAGIIQTAMGHVVVARGDLRQAYFAINGDKLYEQDVVFTLKASKCRIKLLNNDIITLGDRTRITVKEVSVAKGATEKKTNLSMAQGKAMFYAIRVLSQKSTAMTVETPTTVAGVRGTKFGMEVAIEGENNTAALPLLLADASADWGRHLILAQAPPPPNVTTTVHGFDGTVTVTSTVDGRTQSVGAGQTVSATPQGVGAVMPTPPQVAQRFQAATDVPPPAGSGSSSGGGQSSSSSQSSGSSSGNAPDQKQSSDNTGTSNTNMPDTSNITQQQNVNQEEKKEEEKQKAAPAKDPVTDPKTNAPGAGGSSGQRKGYGYFATLLSNTTDGTLAGAFASQYRYDGDSSVWARGPNDADYVRVIGDSGVKGGATLKWVVFDSGNKNSGELTSSISSTTLGENDYMEWGYAIIGNTFTVDGKSYAFNNRAYWIFGGNIPSMNLSGQVTYTGAAYGTYWSAAGGKNMTGTFKTDVNLNLTSNQLSNFSLDVSGNGASAYIHNASGTIGSDAAFSITGGTWNLNGVTPDYTTAKGSLYGSYGTSMGGVWGMYSSTTNTAAGGIFAGTNAQKGHYAGMLEYVSGGQHYYSDTYMTTTSAQDFNSATAQASNSSYSTTINGTGTPKNMTALTVNTWTGSKPVSFAQLGANEYMEWGTWTQTNAMSTTTGMDYYFNNKGAYVWGSPTTVDEMTTLKQNAITGNYSGPAWGTLFAAGGTGTSLTGNFNGTVNFSSQTITNFKIDVSPTGAGTQTPTVYISGASGNFSNGTSTFTINTSQGETWQIKGNTSDPAKSGASGTVYGNGPDKGKYIGGVWKAGDGVDRAVGGFQGSK